MITNVDVEVNIIDKLLPLFEDYRYKIAFGGRGGTKSWAFGDALLTLGLKNPLRILCARELQKSIKDSVHKLLCDRIKALGLEGFYTTTETSIKAINGTEFFFVGLKHNANAVKSFEGIDICWVEEAATVSKASWKYLTPTIRKKGSQIWVSFNPELEEDETYQRFIINTPENAVLMNVGHKDNPWFSDELRAEMEHDRKTDHDAYLNIWEGHCLKILEGSIYKEEMIAAQSDGRICKVPYDSSKPVHTSWDLGHADMTSIWFFQKIGFDYRAIDFYQNNLKKLPHYIEVLQSRGYIYGTDYMPHDAANKTLAGASIEKQAKDLGRNVTVVPRSSILSGIQASRAILGLFYFDEEKCADGLTGLRRYRYDIDEDGMLSRKPKHDIYSHPADAFRTLATGYTEMFKSKRTPQVSRGSNGWMNG